MHGKFRKKLLVTLLAGLMVPLAVSAADVDLLQRIEALSSELEALRAQVKANEEKSAKALEQVSGKSTKADSAAVSDLKRQVKKLEDKSLAKWLDVGGSYQFRFDRLSGETKPFVDVNATFANAQQSLQTDFFANPSTVPGSSSYFGSMGMSTSSALTSLMGFAQGMSGVATYTDAQAFLSDPMNAGMVQGIGAFAVPVPSYKPKNSNLMTNLFNLDLGAKATQAVSVTARLSMYKVFGSQTEAALTNAGSAPFAADRVGVFDGTVSHVPSDSRLNVDRVYATWHNIADEPVWFSVGRRPSTAGASTNVRTNDGRPGTGGVPSLLVDYAFDGLTLGYAPDIDGWPGAYAKVCYGVGFESGFRDTPSNSIADTTMLGIAVVPIDTDPLRVWLQWNRGMNIFDAPVMNGTYFGDTSPKANLGDIDWFGIGAMSTIKGIGPGKLQLFADWGLSRTSPNNNVSAQFGFQGLLTGGFFAPEAPEKKTGTAISLGVRYDLPSKTKLGLEFNHGSKNWITFAPAADDVWTSKLGTRGNVYEAYVIQELGGKAISSYFSTAFVRFGVRHYSFKYTGSNNWVGAPVAISDVNGADLMTLTPLKSATDIYATFEVKF